ncbi:MAG: DNA polymerase III subunit gamma/tau [Bacteroidales bacterium]
MENYIVSARKYRPSTFESVVGQRALTQTLRNAIHTNKLAHAYLFCGPRGVGKTTCARIFAKTINCLTPTAAGEACNECESCRAFNEQRSYNIHELDAASNNSVDGIRELISQVQIPPQIGRYKVYIVDEVHMLSTAAFNAFLKTLEEPPRHAVFILATTEKHKILPTILSRCQIYDFNRITLKDTVEHLQYVASREGVTADPQALGVIARKADGGMRDALSIFDQIVSFTGGNLTYQAVIDNLNVLDYEYYFRITDAFLRNEIPQALLILNEIISRGFDPQHFITGLSSHLRDLMVSKDAVTLSLLEVSADVAERYRRQAENCPNPFLYKALEISNECDLNYRASRNKRLLVEIALIRIAQLTAPVQQSQAQSAAGQPLQPLQQQPVQQQPAQQQAAPQSYGMPPQQQQVVNQPQPAPITQQQVAQATISNGVPPSPTPQQRPGAKAGMPGIKNISIRNGVKKPEEEAVAEVKMREMSKPVDNESLAKAWVDFTRTIPKEAILVNTILSCKPTLIEPNRFEVVVDNPEQVDRIKERGANLLYFLRQNLQNSTLTMNVRESEKNERIRIFSDREKYNQMVQTNPDVVLLKEAFGLDLA